MTAKDLYQKYFIDNGLERKELFNAIAEKFEFENVLYPGGFLHIVPSFYFRSVVYIDNDKNAKKFFSDPKSAKEIIDLNKNYSEEANFDFLAEDYTSQLEIELEYFDLLISQYAGIVSQSCKKYLKIGGILLVNNSHGDAGVTFLDKDFKLIGVVQNKNGQQVISGTGLDNYFIPKSREKPTISKLIQIGKSIKYIAHADNYIFQRIS